MFLSSIGLCNKIVMSPDASRMWIRMAQKAIPAILDLRHTPAVLVKTEVASRPASPGMNLLC